MGYFGSLSRYLLCRSSCPPASAKSPNHQSSKLRRLFRSSPGVVEKVAEIVEVVEVVEDHSDLIYLLTKEADDFDYHCNRSLSPPAPLLDRLRWQQQPSIEDFPPPSQPPAPPSSPTLAFKSKIVINKHKIARLVFNLSVKRVQLLAHERDISVCFYYLHGLMLDFAFFVDIDALDEGHFFHFDSSPFTAGHDVNNDDDDHDHSGVRKYCQYGKRLLKAFLEKRVDEALDTHFSITGEEALAHFPSKSMHLLICVTSETCEKMASVEQLRAFYRSVLRFYNVDSAKCTVLYRRDKGCFYTIVDASYGEPVRQGAQKPRRRVTFDTDVVDNCALIAHTSTN